MVDLTPVIRSSDPNESEIAMEDEIKIRHLSFSYKDKTVRIQQPIPNESCMNLFKIQQSGEYRLLLESNIECAFDIQIKRMEVK